MNARRGLGSLALAGLALAGGRLQAQTVGDPHLTVELVAAGFSAPTTMAFIGDGDILVFQKNDGKVRRVIGGVLQAAPVLDLAVDGFGERGGLGLALHPDFPHTGWVYLYYTASSTGADTLGEADPVVNRIVRYRWNGTQLVEPLGLLTLPANVAHNGGTLAFGPDDRLYAIIGDNFRQGFLQNNTAGVGPDDTGVIFRLDAQGRGVADNPFVRTFPATSPMTRYYAYGIRNSFGLAFDPLSGALWETENGPTVFDEVNRIVPGMNGGWSRIMGPDAENPGGAAILWVAPGSTYVDPQFSWRVPVAPTAAAFVDGRRLGCGLEHALVVGSANCGSLYRFALSPDRNQLTFDAAELEDRIADNPGERCLEEQGSIAFAGGFAAPTDLETGPDGLLYVVDHGGAIFRIAPLAGSVPDADGDRVDDACDCAPADAGAFELPRDVGLLRISGKSPTALGWNDQRAASGNGTSYAVLSGGLGALRSSGTFDAACTLASGLTLPSHSDPRPASPVGDGTYYFARAVNGCGAGPAGRSALDGASVPTCP
ncbi:MAG TPA: PQQ-dependent sugar dehydrogenase [Candidatus Polarisedimenticolaceae bacterium]|nr:PQQ-dependent sugar dehydrogenase [Candidatus Polarisedimenticolaceae bacterium]